MGKNRGGSVGYIAFRVQMHRPLLIFIVVLEITDLESIKIIFINSQLTESVIILINWAEVFFFCIIVKRGLESKIMVSQKEWLSF